MPYRGVNVRKCSTLKIVMLLLCMARNPETEIQSAILNTLTKRYPNCWFHRNMVGKAKLGSGFYSSVGLGVSSPDIVGCVNGKFVGLEVKVPGKDATDEQAAWGEMIRRCGGTYQVVNCILDAVSVVDKVLAAP